MSSNSVGKKFRKAGMVFVLVTATFLVISECSVPARASGYHEQGTGTWVHVGESWILLKDFDAQYSISSMLGTSILQIIPAALCRASLIVSQKLDLPAHLRPTRKQSMLISMGISSVTALLFHYYMHLKRDVRERPPYPPNSSQFVSDEERFLAPVHISSSSLSAQLRLSLYRYGQELPMLDIRDIRHRGDDLGSDYMESKNPFLRSGEQGADREGDLNQLVRAMRAFGQSRVQIRLHKEKQGIDLVISTLGAGSDNWNNFKIPLEGFNEWNITDIPKLISWILSPKVLGIASHVVLPIKQRRHRVGQIAVNRPDYAISRGKTHGDFTVTLKDPPRLPDFGSQSYTNYGLCLFDTVQQQIFPSGNCYGADDPICMGVLTVTGEDSVWPLNQSGGSGPSRLQYYPGPVRVRALVKPGNEGGSSFSSLDIPSWISHTALLPVQLVLNLLMHAMLDKYLPVPTGGTAKVNTYILDSCATSFASTPGLSGPVSNASEAERMKCPVCMDTYGEGHAVYETGCGHFFHQECLERWNLRSNGCPMCRDKSSRYPMKRIEL